MGLYHSAAQLESRVAQILRRIDRPSPPMRGDAGRLRSNRSFDSTSERMKSESAFALGAMTVPVGGVDLTLEQASKYLEEPERAVRERVWRQIGRESRRTGKTRRELKQ